MASGTIEQTESRLVVDTCEVTNIAISAKGYKNQDITVSKTGYEPIGIVGYLLGGSGSTWVNVYICRLANSTTARIGLREMSDAAVTITVTVYVLYRKL